MALNFPSAPTEGQIFRPGKVSWIYTGGRWTVADRRARDFNYLVNPGGSSSIQNGDNLSTVNGYYMADQWAMASGIAFSNAGRIATTDPNYSPYYLTAMNTAAKPTLAAGDLFYAYQFIEGTRQRALGGGSLYAVPLVARFTAQASTPGTYAFCVRGVKSADSTYRSYVVPIALTTGSKQFEIPIPADTASAFFTDITMGALGCFFTFAAGTTYCTSTTNQWIDGNFIGVTGQANMVATVNQSFAIGRLGLYADPDNTGRAPPWELPSQRAIIQDGQRYFQQMLTGQGIAYNNAATTPIRLGNLNMVQLRTNPAVAIVPTVTASDNTVSTTISGVATNYANPWTAEFDIASGSAQNVGRPDFLQVSSGGFIALNAR